MEQLIINEEKVKNFDLTDFSDYYTVDNEFYNKAGVEHYRLLAYLSTQFKNSNIIDIGSYLGASALALSCDNYNKVLTFDIVNNILKNSIITSKKKFYEKTNVEFHIANLLEPHTRTFYEHILLKSPLIFVDIDPHNGFMELEIYNYFKSVNYQGILLFDDIHYFLEMKNNFWNKVEDKYKTDLTHLGHFSGTGMVIFNPNIKVVLE